MSKSAKDVVAAALERGTPLSAFAVAELREAEQEGALRANAANVVKAMLAGRPITREQFAEAERYFPAKARAWVEAGGRLAKGGTGGSMAMKREAEASAPSVSGGLANARHERFAQLVAAGKTQTEAYREAYPRSLAWKDKTVWENGSRLAAKVAGRIAELQRAAASAAVCTAREMQERLSRQFRALDEAGEVEAMVKTGALLAKLIGAESATRVELRNGGVTEDYREPPSVAKMSDEALLALVAGGAGEARRA